MRSTLWALAAAGVMLIMTGCGDSVDSVKDDTVDTMEEITDVLKGVKTKSDAEQVKAKLKGLFEDLKENQKKMESLVTKDGSQALKDMSGSEMKEMMEAAGAMGTEMARIMMDPELREVLGDLDR